MTRAQLLSRFAFAALFPAVALLAPLIASERPWSPVRFDPETVDLPARLSRPGLAHWLGTDDLGRDVAARLVHGSRVSVAAGVVASALALFLGSALGSCAGLLGRRADRAVLFSIDVVQALPALVLVAAGAAFLPPSFATAALLIAATSWTDSARIVRAETKRIAGAPFVEAALASGASRVRVVMRHVLPHALPPALATAPYVLGGAVLTEAALSFLGLGTPPPTPSWGRALADGKPVLVDAPWCVLPPAVALLLLVLSARLLGDALEARRRGGN
jgi:peptide/nickel transport system permease protein